jgi:hypothetical protein
VSRHADLKNLVRKEGFDFEDTTVKVEYVQRLKN